MRHLWIAGIAALVIAAGGAIALAGADANDGPPAKGKTVASTTLDELTAGLEVEGAGEPGGLPRAGAVPVDPREAPDLPCTRFAEPGVPGSIGCRDLPRDGCIRPATRVPGDIDCDKPVRRACAILIRSEATETPAVCRKPRP